MATTIYELVNGKVTLNTLSATEVNHLSDTVEEFFKGLGDFLGEGCFTAEDFNAVAVEGALSVDLNGGWCFVQATGGSKLVHQDADENLADLDPSSTLNIYLLNDGTLTVQDSGDPAPAGSHLVSQVVTGASEVTSVDNFPTGRRNLGVLGTVVASDTDASAGTLLDKLAEGSGIVLALLNEGGNEQIQLSVSLAAGSVGTNELATNSVTNAKMADNSVGTNELINGSVTNGKMAANSVGTTNVINGSITAAKLAEGAIDGSALGEGVVEEINMADGLLYKVKSNNTDTTPDYLVEKIDTTGGLTVSEIGGKVVIDGSAYARTSQLLGTHYTTLAAGMGRQIKIDFATVGSWGSPGWDFWATTDQPPPDTDVVEIANGKTASANVFEVHNLVDAAAGAYGDETQIQINIYGRAEGWVAGAGTPATFTEYDAFDLGVAGGGSGDGYVAATDTDTNPLPLIDKLREGVGGIQIFADGVGTGEQVVIEWVGDNSSHMGVWHYPLGTGSTGAFDMYAGYEGTVVVSRRLPDCLLKRIVVYTSAPLTTGSLTATLQVNGVDSNLQVSLSSAGAAQYSKFDYPLYTTAGDVITVTLSGTSIATGIDVYVEVYGFVRGLSG